MTTILGVRTLYQPRPPPPAAKLPRIPLFQPNILRTNKRGEAPDPPSLTLSPFHATTGQTYTHHTVRLYPESILICVSFLLSVSCPGTRSPLTSSSASLIPDLPLCSAPPAGSQPLVLFYTPIVGPIRPAEPTHNGAHRGSSRPCVGQVGSGSRARPSTRLHYLGRLRAAGMAGDEAVSAAGLKGIPYQVGYAIQ